MHIAFGNAEHKVDVEGQRVDSMSAHNIWHTKKEAWAGIDKILPTGGRFGYEEYHNVNGNMAKLMNYMKHARNELKTIEAHLPQNDKSKFKRKEEKKLKMTLDSERNGLYQIKRQLNNERNAYDKSTPQMLAQQPKAAQQPKTVQQPKATQQPTAAQQPKAATVPLKAAQKRVFVDDALYGEGIQGDIRSQVSFIILKDQLKL